MRIHKSNNRLIYKDFSLTFAKLQKFKLKREKDKVSLMIVDQLENLRGIPVFLNLGVHVTGTNQKFCNHSCRLRTLVSIKGKSGLEILQDLGQNLWDFQLYKKGFAL